MEDLKTIINEINEEYKQKEKHLISLENSLAEYKEELDALREKYNFYKIDKEKDEIFKQRMELRDNLYKAKFKYISDVIFNSLQKYIFPDHISKNEERKKFLKWLYETYKIKYDSYYDYIEFETFYNSYIQGNYKDIELEENSLGVYIQAEFYFRGELDDKVEFSIPFQILKDMDNFEKSVDEYFNVRFEQIIEDEKEKNAKKEQAEYELFLKLKGKFEKEN